MYTNLADLEKFARDTDPRPFYLCEYAHAMGNGPGDICDYWETFYKYPRLIGGCIWEWADHSVLDENDIWRYGGDFGEETHDSNFCCDGMVLGDRSYKPATLEIRHAYQPLTGSYESGKLTLTNRYDFTNLKAFQLKVSVVSDGEPLCSASLDADIEPHASKTFDIDLPALSKCRYGAHLNVDLTDDGESIAELQFELPCERKVIVGEGKAVLRDDRYKVYISGDGFDYVFDKHHGVPESMVKGGIPLLSEEARLSVWRATTDNDRNIKKQWGIFNGVADWESERYNALYHKVYGCTVKDNTITVEASLAGVSRAPFFGYTCVYTFFADGKVGVSMEGRSLRDHIFLPRLGFEFTLPEKDQSFDYYGKGPQENYCDLCRAARFGHYESSANDEFYPYPRPQETGNHTDVRSLSLENGLRFTSNQSFEACVLPYTPIELTEAEHLDELPASDRTVVRIDFGVSGIGSNSCGPQLLEKYRLDDSQIKWEFFIN